MSELAESTEVYAVKWLKNKLKEKYGEHIFFAEIEGHANVVCFKDLASYLFNEKWHTERKTNTAVESKNYDTDYYPTIATIENIVESEHYVPETLKQFLYILVKKQLPRVSLPQAIISNARPISSISPILFYASGVELVNQFRSRWLL